MSEKELADKGKKDKVITRQSPQRSCIGCRQVYDKRRLIRLVKLGDGSVEVDISGKKSGRGAYLCPKTSCWQEGLKKDRLDRALHATISKDKRKNLLEYGQNLSNEKNICAAS